MPEISEQLVDRVLSRFDTLQKTVEESRLEMVHMSACYQEQAARLDEFMRDHETRVRELEQNCPHNERWENNRSEHGRLFTSIEDLDVRLNKIERAKCPKSPVLDDIDERLGTIETALTKTQASSETVISQREWILAGLTVVLAVITIWQFYKGAL